MFTTIVDKIRHTVFHQADVPKPDPIEANYKLNYQERNAGKAVLAARPYALELETTTRCNLDCLECPRLDDFVEEELTDDVVDRVAPWFESLNQISLHGFGEPLYSPSTFKVISMLPEGTQIHFSSNLTPLKPEHLVLFKEKKGLINVSLDAATAQTYKLIRGANFEKVVENMRKIRQLSQMDLYMNMTVMQMNKHEVRAFLDLAESIGASRVIFIKLSESYDFVKTRKDFRFVYKEQHLGADDVARMIEQIEARKWPFAIDNYVGLKFYPAHVEKPVVPAPAVPAPAVPAPAAPAPAAPAPSAQTSNEPICAYPWVNLFVKIDGSVRNCCHQEPIGNLKTQSLDEIWNSDLEQEIRAGIASKNLHAACQRVNCPVWRQVRQEAEVAGFAV